jgi:integrase
MMLEAMETGTLRTNRRRQFRPGTIACYRGFLKRHINPGLGEVTIGELRRREVQEFIDERVASGLSAGSVESMLNPLRTLLRWARRLEVITTDPMSELEVPYADKRRFEGILPEQALLRVQLLIGRVRLAWALAFFAGLRRGELLALQIEDIDVGGEVINVRRSWDERNQVFIPPKSASGERQIPVISVLRRELETHIDRMEWGRGLLLGEDQGTPYSEKEILEKANRVWRRVGLQAMSLREARHAFFSFMNAAEIDLKAFQLFGGHADARLGLEVYTHPLPGAVDQARERLDRLMSGHGLGRRPSAMTDRLFPDQAGRDS